MHKLYPEADCELNHTNAYELLFATIMSAQSTDVNVNKVTEYLFQKYRTTADYAKADPAEFDSVARKLAGLFSENFAQYADGVSEEVRRAGPVLGP